MVPPFKGKAELPVCSDGHQGSRGAACGEIATVTIDGDPLCRVHAGARRALIARSGEE